MRVASRADDVIARQELNNIVAELNQVQTPPLFGEKSVINAADGSVLETIKFEVPSEGAVVVLTIEGIGKNSASEAYGIDLLWDDEVSSLLSKSLNHGGVYRPLSHLRTKKIGKGVHTITVNAISGTGNLDAAYNWQVRVLVNPK